MKRSVIIKEGEVPHHYFASPQYILGNMNLLLPESIEGVPGKKALRDLW